MPASGPTPDEDATQASLLKLKGVLDSSRNFIGILAPDGTLLDINRTALQAVDVLLDDVVGKPFWDTPWWQHSAEQQARLREAVRCAAGGERDGFAATHSLPNGSLLHVDFTLTPVMDEANRVLHLIPESLDVTAVREHAEQLERAKEDLESFAYVASHELQEPLRKIAAYSELIQKECGELNDAGKRHLSVVINGAQRLEQLVSDLLVASRNLGASTDRAPTDANECLGEALRQLELPIQESGAIVTSGTLPAVYANHGELTLLFQNLVGNAIKYHSGTSPTISVGSRELADGVCEFRVVDNGIGIEPEHRNTIFDLFQRLHGRQEYGGGSGIGLANCKRIVQRHGGQIWVESVPGEGSTFFFTLGKVE